ncbi:LPXTG cell wall anchor domain-containing protein [Candidatus Saccharibacteria bacterium]|nr:LPXTG cell wall anchor domain-containing protein [Candidatus Saccharibacteria bacterium]
MKKQRLVYGFIAIALTVLSLMPATAYAATQTVVVPTQAVSDDPHINSDVLSPMVSAMGVNLQAPLNNTTTPLDDASLMPAPSGYTWRLVVPEMCEGAQLESLRIVTSTLAVDEEPTTGLFLGLYGSNNLTMLSSYSVNSGNGEDGNSWVPSLFSTDAPVIDRGTTGSFGPATTFPANLGMAGTLDGTWDISGYTPGEPLGVYIQHWLSGDLTTAQTTIESVTLTYDDAGCASSVSGGSESSDAAQAGLAATGDNTSTSTIVAVALLISSFVLILGNRRKLFS